MHFVNTKGALVVTCGAILYREGILTFERDVFVLFYFRAFHGEECNNPLRGFLLKHFHCLKIHE